VRSGGSVHEVGDDVLRTSAVITQFVAEPAVTLDQCADMHLKYVFEDHLVKEGGAAQDIGSSAEAEAELTALHPVARVVCSAVPEIAGTRRVAKVHDPHELADVDVGVIRAQFGVAESGAVWLTQEDLVVDALAFLSQHLGVLLDPEQIVPDMHEAYPSLPARAPRPDRIRLLHDGAVRDRGRGSNAGSRRTGSSLIERILLITERFRMNWNPALRWRKPTAS